MNQRDAPAIHLLENILAKQEIDTLATFEIMYNDLPLEAQNCLCEAFDTNSDMENWEIQPLAIVTREMNES